MINSNLDVPAVTLSTQDYTKPLQQLKSGLRHEINILIKNINVGAKPIFRLLNWSKFSGRLFVLSFEITTEEQHTKDNVFQK